MNTRPIVQETLEQIDPAAAEAHKRGEITDQDATNLVLSYAAEKVQDLETRVAALEASATDPDA